MGKRIINGQKMLLMKQLHNKNYLVILASFFLEDKTSSVIGNSLIISKAIKTPTSNILVFK